MATSGPSIRAAPRATPTIRRWTRSAGRNRKPPDAFSCLAAGGQVMRKDLLAGVGVAAAVLGGAAFYYLREKSAEEPGYRPLETDGDHQIRDYPALTVAETVVNGARKDALKDGYRILSDYL